MADDTLARARAMLDTRATEQYGGKSSAVLWGERFVRLDAATAVLAEVLAENDRALVAYNAAIAQRDALAADVESFIRKHGYEGEFVYPGSALAAVRGGSDG